MRAKYNLQPWVSEELAHVLNTRNGIEEVDRFIFNANEIVNGGTVNCELASRAAACLQSEGIVLITQALGEEQLQAFRDVFPSMIEEVRQLDPADEGSGGEKRHSFGRMSSTNSQLHRPEWQALVDIPAITEILEKYWGSKDFAILAAGGDLNMAGSRQHQNLHSDLSGSKLMGPQREIGTGVKSPMIVANFLIEEQTRFNGPLQHIPRTQLLDRNYLMEVQDEPMKWFFSTMCPAPAGTAVIRDPRTWHAGSPNITTLDRPLPNCEFVAPFVLSDPVWQAENKVVPQITHEVWARLPPRAKHLTRLVKAREGEKVEPVVTYRKLPYAIKCQISPLFRHLGVPLDEKVEVLRGKQNGYEHQASRAQA